MKLLRYGPRGREKPGLLDAGGAIRDLSGVVVDLAPGQIAPDSLERLAGLDATSLPKVPGSPRLGLPVVGTAKVLCVGLNYIDHANEVGAPIPKDAIYFQKPITALTGPNDPIIKPVDSTMLDWEVELVVVMGSKAQYIGEGEAMDHIAGFALGNDVSEREFQTERSGQWTKGKSHDSFAPIGPWLVTKDEIADVQNLDMWLDVNGERMQTGNTSRMIFSVVEAVAYASRFMTLMPGDVIMTGTPPGVGGGMKPPRFLDVGDEVRLGIEGLGTARQTVVSWEDRPQD